MIEYDRPLHSGGISLAVCAEFSIARPQVISTVTNFITTVWFTLRLKDLAMQNGFTIKSNVGINVIKGHFEDSFTTNQAAE